MTVPLTQRRAGPFQGDGVNDEFEFGFLSFDAADVRPLVMGADGVELALVADVDYTVTLYADQVAAPGGTVTFTTPPTIGQTVVILSQVSFEQPVALPPGGSFRAEAVEGAIDRLAMLSQQLREQTSRSIKLHPSIAPDESELVLPFDTPNTVIGWGEDGLLRNYELSGLQAGAGAGFARDSAEAWADTPEDQNVTVYDQDGNPIATTDYSARHWAAKAAANSGALASGVAYVNTASGLTATDVQAAIDELNTLVDELNTLVDGETTNVFTITDGASVDIDPIDGGIQIWTLGANRSPTVTNFLSGQSVTLHIIASAFTITWPTIKWVGGTAPTLNTSGQTIIVLWKVGVDIYGALTGATT